MQKETNRLKSEQRFNPAAENKRRRAYKSRVVTQTCDKQLHRGRLVASVRKILYITPKGCGKILALSAYSAAQDYRLRPENVDKITKPLPEIFYIIVNHLASGIVTLL